MRASPANAFPIFRNLFEKARKLQERPWVATVDASNRVRKSKGACCLRRGNDLAYEYEYTPAFAKWQRLLSPEQYEIVEVRTSRRLSRVMLFSKAIIRAERAAKQRST